ncbi:MAG TPA: helix-turn-helix transcriptional regulator [Parafilimonas sp.]|nr:helix-turn-helix transcriptional regulator [Parafilimonas sp.]
MHIGKTVKQIRVDKNLKQSAVAAAIGMSVTAYSNIESGKTNNVTLQRLEEIAGALGVPGSAIILEAAGNTKVKM